MKQLYLLLLTALPLFAASSYAQESQEEKQWTEILQTADTASLIKFMRQFEPWEPLKTPEIQNRQENDTALAMDGVMCKMLYMYRSDQLVGVSRYKEMTKWPKQIVIQPEIEVCFVSTPDIDYRGVFSGKYTYYDLLSYDDWLDRRQKGSRLDVFIPAYSDLPDLTGCKKYRYRRWIIDVQDITMDTLTQIRLEKYFLERVDLLDLEKIQAVIPCNFGRKTWGIYKGEPFASLTYNIWIEKMIFNPALDQCIVQTSTRRSAYEFFLLKINKEWIIAHSVERRHFDYLSDYQSTSKQILERKMSFL